MNLNYKQIGEGYPIIILHGLFGSLDNWISMAKKISKLNFEIFTVDLRNHGKSPHSNEFDYKSMSFDIYEFLNVHNIVNPVILGHSMGGKVAMQFALDFPDAIKKLVVVDVAPISYPVHHQYIIDALNSVNLNIVKTREEVKHILNKFIDDSRIIQFLLKNLYWEGKNKLAWRFNLPVIAKNIETISKNIILNKANSFTNPVLFLKGANSDYIPKNSYSVIEKLFPNYKIITIKNAGHWIHADNPDDFFNSIKDFLIL